MNVINVVKCKVKLAFNVNEGEKSGQLVMEAKNITQQFNDKCSD